MFTRHLLVIQKIHHHFHDHLDLKKKTDSLHTSFSHQTWSTRGSSASQRHWITSACPRLAERNIPRGTRNDADSLSFDTCNLSETHAGHIKFTKNIYHILLKLNTMHDFLTSYCVDCQEIPNRTPSNHKQPYPRRLPQLSTQVTPLLHERPWHRHKWSDPGFSKDPSLGY